MDAARRVVQAAATGLLPGRGQAQVEARPADEEEMEEESEKTEDMDNEAAEDHGNDTPQTFEQLLLYYEASPEDPLLRAAVKAEIKRRYIENGGVPLNSKDPIPVDLDTLSPKEIIHVAQNLQIYLVRSRKDDIVSRFLNIFANITYLTARFRGANINNSINQAFAQDHLLRQSFVEVFVGRTAQIHPLLTLGVAGISHLTNILVQSIDGQSVKPVDTSRITIGGGENKEARPGGGKDGNSGNTPAPPST